jgi:hypothetical protein
MHHERWRREEKYFVTVVVVRSVLLYRSGRTTALESKSDEERRY